MYTPEKEISLTLPSNVWLIVCALISEAMEEVDDIEKITKGRVPKNPAMLHSALLACMTDDGLFLKALGDMKDAEGWKDKDVDDARYQAAMTMPENAQALIAALISFDVKKRRKEKLKELICGLESLGKIAASELLDNEPHKHKCKDCGTIWKHSEAKIAEGCTDDKGSSAKHNAAHHCPKCGSEQYRIYHGDKDAVCENNGKVCAASCAPMPDCAASCAPSPMPDVEARKAFVMDNLARLFNTGGSDGRN